MQVSFNWVPEKAEGYQTQSLVMTSKMIKGNGIVVAEVSEDGIGRYVGGLLNEHIDSNKDNRGFANRETAIRNVERRFGIYKAPKKSKKSKKQ